MESFLVSLKRDSTPTGDKTVKIMYLPLIYFGEDKNKGNNFFILKNGRNIISLLTTKRVFQFDNTSANIHRQ